ncbi:hypothetical protein DKP78_25885, partial [Enterococcus faecium]
PSAPSRVFLPNLFTKRFVSLSLISEPPFHVSKYYHIAPIPSPATQVVDLSTTVVSVDKGSIYCVVPPVFFKARFQK